METTTFNIEYLLNLKGCVELMKNKYIKSSFKSVLIPNYKIDNEEYFNLLISLSEYSFCNTKDFNNLFHYDYSNNIDYQFIYSSLSNPIIKCPFYNKNLYCDKHKVDDYIETCIDCLERYRIITRNLIPIIKKFRKDLCSIYFIDMLYDLIRFENRNLYSLITCLINNHKDGSSFKQSVNNIGKKKIVKLFKTINKPFRRIDYKFIFKKYLPLIYNIYLYCDKQYLDYKDVIYDFMLSKGLSMFKTVPSKYIVVGYENNNKYILDVVKTKEVINFRDDTFKIASHGLLEGINFGFYDERQMAYIEVLNKDKEVKEILKPIYSNIEFTGESVFTKTKIKSDKCIIIGFLKKSENTFQNFRLDIHIDSFLTNNKEVDHLRRIGHDKWK
jgi:hypothetical protein